jgi:hypothetical protein
MDWAGVDAATAPGPGLSNQVVVLVNLSIMVIGITCAAFSKPSKKGFPVGRVPMLIAAMVLFILIAGLLCAAAAANLPGHIDDVSHASRRSFGALGLTNDALMVTLAILLLVPVVGRLRRVVRHRKSLNQDPRDGVATDL